MPQTCGASESSATSCESRAREGGAESPTGGSWAALPLKGLVWVLVESPPQSQEGSSSYPAPPVCPTPVCPVESAAPVAFLSEWLALTLTPHPGPVTVPHADQAGVFSQECGVGLVLRNLPLLV